MIRPIRKPPYYSTSIDPTRTKYEIEAMVKSFGAEAVQFTEVYEQKFVELKFMLEIDMEGKPFRGVFSFHPKPLYETKKVKTVRGWEKKGVVNWAATYRLLYHYLENLLSFISWGGIEGFQSLLGHAMLRLTDGTVVPVSDALKTGVLEMGVKQLEALPQPQPPKIERPRREGDVIEAHGDGEVVEGELIEQ